MANVSGRQSQALQLCVPGSHFKTPKVHEKKNPSHCRPYLEASERAPCSDWNKLGSEGIYIYIYKSRVKTLLSNLTAWHQSDSQFCFEFGDIKAPNNVAAKAHRCKSLQKVKIFNAAHDWTPTLHISEFPLTTLLWIPEPWIKWAMVFCPTPTPSKFRQKGALIPFGSSWSCTRGLGETSFDSRSYDFELFQIFVTNNLCPLVLSYLDVRVTFYFFYFLYFFLLFQWTGIYYLTLIRVPELRYELMTFFLSQFLSSQNSQIFS